MTLLLLLSTLSFADLESSEYDVLEFFCGVGRIATLAAAVGLRAVKMDLLMDKRRGRSKAQRKSGRPARSRMDLNGEVGFLLLV